MDSVSFFLKSKLEDLYKGPIESGDGRQQCQTVTYIVVLLLRINGRGTVKLYLIETSRYGTNTIVSFLFTYIFFVIFWLYGKTIQQFITFSRNELWVDKNFNGGLN